ncbi:MAG: Na/Pi cotransporter family protein [Tabrizicola sp.]|uniref:Na/Pi cotransporter family protein n=1 Tax=Tabrizicola sp. TaxID=2005166 RepID=UPI003BB0207E
MSGTWVLLDLLGGVALLLWGVRMVRTGITRAWGDSLRAFLERRLSNRAAAFGGGVAASTVLGSATATTLIVASLAGAGAVQPATGLAVLLGADVGSAVVSGLLASGSSLVMSLAPLMLLAGYVTFSAATEFRPRNAGRVLLGFGLMFLALGLIIGATAPLRGAGLFHQVLGAIAAEPMLAFLGGAILAWLCHSTMAVVLLLSSFVLNGSLAPDDVLPFVLGLNFGGGLPAISATLDQPALARRLPIANMICRGTLAVGLLAVSGLLPPMPLAGSQGVALLHAAFNILAALVFLPLTGPLLRAVERLVPDHGPDHGGGPQHLNRSALAMPSVALTNAALETVQMAGLVTRMQVTALEALSSGRLEPLQALGLMDARIGTILRAVQTYLQELSEAELSDAQSRRARDILIYASNLEHAGDLIKLNLADRVRRKVRQKIDLPPEELAAISRLSGIIETSLQLIPGAVASDDVGAATQLASQKDTFRRSEETEAEAHLGRDGASRNPRVSALFLDIVRDLHGINSRIAAAGYPRVLGAGMMRETRLIAAEE